MERGAWTSAAPRPPRGEGIRRLEAFYHALGLSTRLSGLGVATDRLDEMARKCTDGGKRTLGNFVKLDREAVRKIYELAV